MLEEDLPTTNTAEKEMRVAERRKVRNKSIHSQTKTKISQAEAVIASGDLEAAIKEVKHAVSALDKETGKKKVHSNNAARRKSRLMKKLNKAAASSKAQAAK
jgi:small subunit ribosomal protein S20